ncbi:MAG: TetR/AcrR family transcriptional regulator, partial [Alphaproteobacteria bacterium]
MALSPDLLKAAYGAVVDKGWSRLTLTDIAAAADMSLADLRKEMSSKYDLIGALNRHVDAEVLNEIGTID